MVADQANPQTVILASHMGVNLNPGYPTSGFLLMTLVNSGGWPKCLDPYIHVGDSEETPGSQL